MPIVLVFFLVLFINFGTASLAKSQEVHMPLRIGADLARILKGPLALAAPARDVDPVLFFEGSRLFHTPWQRGLGPNQKANACTSCHTNNGRMPPIEGGLLDRWSPPLVGLGLLAEVPHQDLLGLSDPEDLNNDGVFGQLGEGRFGWGAETPTLRSAVGRALCEDMGVLNMASTTPECFGTDATESDITALVAYVAGLAIPDRPPPSKKALLGERLFTEIGCQTCHTPVLHTQDGQVFYPFTNLLLHDMGPALGDGSGNRLWRTAPLWTIGRQPTVSPTHYLHDGRAKTLEAAILWHGGEAQNASEAFISLPPKHKQAVIAFLKSL